MVKASLIRVTAGLTFPVEPKYNYIGSSTISLWSVPGSSTQYAVSPRVQAYFENGKFRIREFFAGVSPYRETTGPQYQQIRIRSGAGISPANLYSYSQFAQSCVYEEDGKCGIRQDFAPDTRVRLRVRLSKEVGGWFHGRLKDPIMDVTNFSDTGALVTIDAAPSNVPRMAFLTNRSTFNENEKVLYQNMGYWPTIDDGNGSGPQAGAPNDAFPFIDYYRARVKDTAVATNTFWNLSTTSWGAGSRCLQDKSKLLGIVTTNAMAYDGDSPSFENGTLNYHVSGLHYMPDGVTPVQGSYNLVMRSEVARCLYGLSPAPIKAAISVVGGSDSIVATTTQDESNGWLSLSANGFTFSQKNIQVKITQDVPVTAPTTKPSAAPVAPKPIAKQITITCTKGKISKKVTAIKPTCPKGYKKK